MFCAVYSAAFPQFQCVFPWVACAAMGLQGRDWGLAFGAVVE